MDALSLKYSEESTNKLSKATVLDTDLCIGCGVCAHKCPTDSLSLVQNAETVHPPKTGREFIKSVLTDQQTKK
jgi:formate hydrogenlyase subunit 6/NADH:ubiquinone oxidoreductase subunit I